MDVLLDWLKDAGTILGVAGGLTGLIAFFLRYSTLRDKVEQYVREDPEYRDELAAELRGGRISGLYQNALAAALDWLDRRFGAPGSEHALGICIIIALYYAYAAFFLAWGVGGPGDIAGIETLEVEAEWSVRLPASLFLIAALPLAYGLGHWLGRQERRLKVRLRRQRGWRRRPFELTWRGIVVIVVCGLSLAVAGDVEAAAGLIILFSLGAIGPSAGALTGWRMGRSRFASILAALAGALALAVALPFAVAGAVAVTVAVAGAVAGALAVAFAGAGALAGALAGAGAVVFPGALAFPGPLAVAGAVAAIAGAVAGAGVIGALNAQRWRRGVFAGGIGGLTGPALVVLTTPGAGRNEVVVVLLVLFLILPLVNGLWDWLSWWISRRLGRDLLAKLRPERSSSARAWTVAWHALADLIAAVLLLAAMAYLLALGFAVYNQIAIALDTEGIGPFNLEGFIARAAAAPWTDGLWLTVMLISTLVPTFLHLVMLVASPIALAGLPTERRLALASDLKTYADQPERQASIRRRAADYVTRDKHGAIALSTFLLVLLLAALGGVVAMLHRGGLADYVLTVAVWGIHTARWLAG